MRDKKYLQILAIIAIFFAGFWFAQPVNATNNSFNEDSLFIELSQKISQYFNSQFSINYNLNPVIISALVEPEKVIPGDIMTVTTKIKDNFGIKSVIADMGGIETIELKQIDGDIYQGTWENKWKVHSTEVKDYVTTIIVTNIFNQNTIKEIEWSDPPINWGDDTQQGTQTTISNWFRCIGGTFDLSNAILTGIYISSGGSGNFRLAVYQGGTEADPNGATLVWDAGQITAGTGFIGISGGNISLAANEVTWICAKDNDSTVYVHYNTCWDSSSDFQSGRGRWVASGMSTDEAVPFESLISGAGTSFSNFWYSWYLIYTPCIVDGSSCSVNGDCCSNNCQNDICCAAGQTCCSSDSNCSADSFSNCIFTDNYCDTVTDHYCKSNIDAWCYRVNSEQQEKINKHDVCSLVTNNNINDIFVPVKIADEWTAFRTYASGVTCVGCCVDNDGDGYGVCPDCGIAASDCTYDGNDCCDTDSGSYPGADYHDSTNNCGSWDWDCDTVITKSYKCAKITSCSCGGCDETQTRLCEPEVEPCTAFYKTGTENYYDCGESAAVNSCYYTAYNSDCVGMYSANHIGLAPKSWAYGIGCLCTIPPEPIDPGGTYYNCTCK